MPSHEQVISAVEATGDKELMQWVEGGQYTARRVDNSLLTAHALYQVFPTHTSHPMSFYMALDLRGGGAFVTTGNAEGLARLVRADPELAESPEFPAWAVEWLSLVPDTLRILSTPDELPPGVRLSTPPMPPVIDRTPDGVRLELFVIDPEGRVKQWILEVPREGQATLRTSRVPAL